MVDFQSQGLQLVGHGDLRTANCPLCGGKDSLMIDTRFGNWACPDCGAFGADIVAFHMKRWEQTYAEALGGVGVLVPNWNPCCHSRRRFSERDAIRFLRNLASQNTRLAARLTSGVLTEDDRDSVCEAAYRIDFFARKLSQSAFSTGGES